MIQIAEGFENPRQKLIRLVEWLTSEFESLPDNQKRVLIDYVNAWYDFASNARLALEQKDNLTARASANRLHIELRKIKDELLGYGLSSEVTKIEEKIKEINL